MTATPIPRTLAITLYGDQDLSVIREYPAGRKEIWTRIIHESKRREAYRFILEHIQNGRQIYWVSPLVEESETLDYENVVEMTEKLTTLFPDCTVGMIHGRMSQKEKDSIMNDFADNTIHILSSTSVVEVGVDNPNATIMCIEGADRF